MRKFLLTPPQSVVESTCEVCVMHRTVRHLTRHGVAQHFSVQIKVFSKSPVFRWCWGTPRHVAFWDKLLLNALRIQTTHVVCTYQTRYSKHPPFPLLILQAIMIFCGGMAFDAVLLTAYPRSARRHVGRRLQGEVLCRQTLWSRVYVFVVMCLVAARSLSLTSLCSGR